MIPLPARRLPARPARPGAALSGARARRADSSPEPLPLSARPAAVVRSRATQAGPRQGGVP